MALKLNYKGKRNSREVILSPRTGRPKAENPKNINFSIKLDAELERKLKAYCEEHKITKGEAIRQGIHLLLANKK